MADTNQNTNGLNIEIKDWNGYDFNNYYGFSFCNENVAYVPQVLYEGLNQLQRNDLWLRYYLFNTDKTSIIAVVTVGPNIETTPADQRVGEYGLTPDVRNILGLTNVYDTDNGEKYIGYGIFLTNPNVPIPGSSPEEYPGSLYANFPEGNNIKGNFPNDYLSEPIITTGGDGLYTVAVKPAHPTVSFIGNVEEAEFDPENPDIVYYASGYELQYANDYMDAFKNAMELRAISLIIGEGIMPVVQGSAPGEYVTHIMPTDLRVGQGENPREDQNMWRNFDPMFKVIRQIKLIIKSGELDQTGVSIPISASKYYDGEIWAPEVRVPEGTVVRYSTDDGSHWSTSPASIENVGTIYVTVEITGLPGQTEALYYYYYLQVLPRPIYITSDSMSWNYNGSRNTCDWVTVQGHYDEDEESRVQTRFCPPEGSRKITGIPLIKYGDTLEIEFKGGQTEIGSSNNAFDFEIKSNKPNNYDVRVEFGLLKVGLNSEDIYVFIRGNTKGTWKEEGDPNILWDNDLEAEQDRDCHYNGGIWTVSGWRVVAVTDEIAGIIQDPYDPHHDITIPNLDPEHDMSRVYGAKNVEFIGKDTAAEISGVYINNIIDPTDINFWHPIEYRSTLSELNFRNINPNFSDNHIHFIVTPNRLLISKCETNINIAGHSQDFDFNMVKDGDKYIPEERTISGYDAISDVDIYNLADTTYKDPNDETKTTPSITKCCWNEEDSDGKWYMGLDDDIHEELPDTEKPFENGFINLNKNFEVSYHLLLDDDNNPLDGYICIHPLRVNVSIRGTKETRIYDGVVQELRGIHGCPEIWWKSDCEFFNYPAILDAISNDEQGLYNKKWVMEINEEIEIDPYRKTSEESETIQVNSETPRSASPDTPTEDPNKIIARSNYYRSLHDRGYFEWTDDGYAHNTDLGERGTEINNISDDSDPDYWNPIPYPFNLIVGDFHEDKTSVFPDTNFKISDNFEVTFEIIEDGSLTILPYSEEVKVYIVGNSGEISPVSGYESTADTDIYHPDADISGPENPTVSGTEPGSYLMGLSAGDFENINKNFTNVTFLVTDGWLLIVGQGTEQDPTGDTNICKIFDNVGVDISSIPISGGSETPRYTMVTPGYTPAEIGNRIDSEHNVEWIIPEEDIYDTGTIYFKIESSDEESDIDIPGMVVIEPLRIEIISGSGAWIYDGESHLLDEVDIRVLNNDPSNISSILSFVGGITYTGWKEITSVGTISNSFDIDSIPFSEHVSNKTYAVNGKLYDENGEVIGDWIETDKHDITPNVIITIQFGTLTISDSLEVKIKGLQKTITYDGRLHTLTGYEVYYNDAPIDMHIALKSTFQYEETIDQRDARPAPYEMGLDVDSFDWPIGITGEVEDGWLEIKKRDLIFKTGSDTGHWSDEEPEYIAKNESYTVIGLADTDHIELTGDWKSQSGPGSTRNDIEYSIIHISGAPVKDLNYNYENIWGKLRINEASDSPMYYRIMGIRKNPSDKNTAKVHIEGLKGIDYFTKNINNPSPGNRMVDEDRFYPILHKLVPIPEDGIVDFDDIICIVPLFKHSKKMENVTWLFENKSTGEKIFSKIHDRPIFPDGIYGGALPEYKNHGGLADTPILNIVPKELKPGYYDVTVNYRMDHKDYSQKFSSVFMIRKKA